VEDSPNSYGVAIDSIRCVKLALERGQGGVLEGPSAYFCKHPPRLFDDDKAYQMTENSITQYPEKVREMSDYRKRQKQKISADS
jgi:myo-inositol-1-phosphate synthase